MNATKKKNLEDVICLWLAGDSDTDSTQRTEVALWAASATHTMVVMLAGRICCAGGMRDVRELAARIDDLVDRSEPHLRHSGQ